MPPGSGDIQITLGQNINIDASVIVSTPHNLSYIDVVKGIETFHNLKIPSICLIENMAYYMCPCCDNRENIFGNSKVKQIQTQFGIKNSFEIPLLKEISNLQNIGQPPILVLSEEHPFSKIYKTISGNIIKDLYQIDKSEYDKIIKYNKNTNEVIYIE